MSTRITVEEVEKKVKHAVVKVESVRLRKQKGYGSNISDWGSHTVS